MNLLSEQRNNTKFLSFLKNQGLDKKIEIESNGDAVKIKFKNFYRIDGKSYMIIYDSTISIIERKIMSGEICFPAPCCDNLGFQIHPSEKKYCNCQYGKSKEIEATFEIPILDLRTNTIYIPCDKLRIFLKLSPSQSLLLTKHKDQPILCVNLNIPSGCNLSDNTSGKVFKINETYLVIIDLREISDIKFCDCKFPRLDLPYLNILIERSTNRPFFCKESKELIDTTKSKYEFIFVISNTLRLLQYTLLNNLILSGYSFTHEGKKIIFLHKCTG